MDGGLLMRRSDILVVGQEQLDIITALLKEGWVPDPVLMPSGRPNVVEGVGAVYHLVFADLSGGEDVQTYIQLSRFAEPEKPAPPGEFAGVGLSAMLPHGVHPESQEQFKRVEGFAWEFYKAYEKVAVWLRRPQQQGASP